jgi:hypothetical protein
MLGESAASGVLQQAFMEQGVESGFSPTFLWQGILESSEVPASRCIGHILSVQPGAEPWGNSAAKAVKGVALIAPRSTTARSRSAQDLLR